jgi:hypothetical protein
LHVENADDAFAHFQRDRGFRVCFGQQWILVIGGIPGGVIDDQRFAFSGDKAHDRFGADAELVTGTLHLRAGFAGRFADHHELTWQILEKDRRVIKIEARADQLHGLLQKFVQVE